MKTARFWHWSNRHGYVRIALEPGQEVTFSGGGRTEEGYHWWEETYRHEGDRITSTSSSSSRDCDGRIDNSSHWECKLDELEYSKCYDWQKIEDGQEARSWEEPAIGIRMPNWTEVKSRQRDYAAEAMGY